MLLQVSNLSKSFGTRTILSNITLQIQERERVGLVGVNGAGKSTLLQIIAGEMSYDDGDIFKAKDARIGYLAQNGGLNADRSIAEEMLSVFDPIRQMEQELRQLEAQMAEPDIANNPKQYEEIMNRYAVRSELFRELGGYEYEARIRSVLHGMGFAGIAPETPIRSLSGGQKTRLALAKLLLEQPDLLLLDEPTNHLDIETLNWLEDYLRAYPGAILVVSHDRYFLDALVQTIYEIERHSARRYTGNYSRFVATKAAEYEAAVKKYEKQQEEIAKMEDFIRRNIARASTTKRAQSRRKALERMERMEKPQGALKRASFSFEIDKISGNDVLHAENLAISYDGNDPLIRNVSLQLTRGESVALIGPNGIGKTSLLKALIGRIPLMRGEIRWGANVSIGYYDQEQTDLNPDNTVLEEVWSAFPHLEEVRIRTVLGNFLFSGEDVLKKVGSLSGGEKARVALAKLMLLNANVLIFDEPTNHLDLYSKEVLESALLEYEGTLLFISHDRYFLNKMAERVLELAPDGLTEYLGNYDDYVAKKRELAEPASSENNADGKGRPATRKEHAAKAAGGGLDYETAKMIKQQERNRQRRLEQLEDEIERLEADIAQLEEELASPDVYHDYMKVQETTAAIEEKKRQLQHRYEEWEELV